MEPVFIPLVLTAVTLSFLVSASAGFGGSLLLVPTLALVMGTKSGVALAALLLAANNVVKLIAYRKTLPWRRSALIVLLVGIGAGVGAVLLVAAPERVVTIAVILGFGLAFLTERLDLRRVRVVEALRSAHWSWIGSIWSERCRSPRWHRLFRRGSGSRPTTRVGPTKAPTSGDVAESHAYGRSLRMNWSGSPVGSPVHSGLARLCNGTSSGPPSRSRYAGSQVA